MFILFVCLLRCFCACPCACLCCCFVRVDCFVVLLCFCGACVCFWYIGVVRGTGFKQRRTNNETNNQTATIPNIDVQIYKHNDTQQATINKHDMFACLSFLLGFHVAVLLMCCFCVVCCSTCLLFVYVCLLCCFLVFAFVCCAVLVSVCVDCFRLMLLLRYVSLCLFEVSLIC